MPSAMLPTGDPRRRAGQHGHEEEFAGGHFLRSAPDYARRKADNHPKIRSRCPPRAPDLLAMKLPM
jgi:hypothetical protein